jgi:hypothetical protein
VTPEVIESTTPDAPSLGPLVAALAKAQTEFATVTRDKTVTVQTKTGGSYKFSYAPLDTILAAVRGPLSKNGLVVVQTLDDGALVTSLLHESGASISGRMALPSTNDIQGLGSAITYLRRYAIQAVLGIAAEEDDDGNRATGNRAEPKASETTQVGGETLELMGIDTLSGIIKKGSADRYQCEWRDLPDGSHVIGFALKRNGDKDLPQVGLMGDVAATLYASGDFQLGSELIGQKVTMKGRFYAVRQTGRSVYTRVIVGQGSGDFLETDDWRFPALLPDATETAVAEAAPEPLWDGLTDEEKALIAEGAPG